MVSYLIFFSYLPYIDSPIGGGVTIGALGVIPPVGIAVAGRAPVIFKQIGPGILTLRRIAQCMAAVTSLYFHMPAGE